MPKYYCDYCDVFLTHDSPSVRKSHNNGWKHKAAVRTYYSQFEEDITQALIDAKVKEFEGRLAGGLPFPFHTPPYTPAFPPPVFPYPPPGNSHFGPGQQPPQGGVLPFPYPPPHAQHFPPNDHKRPRDDLFVDGDGPDKRIRA